jgi:hypothetical protein
MSWQWRLPACMSIPAEAAGRFAACPKAWTSDMGG